MPLTRHLRPSISQTFYDHARHLHPGPICYHRAHTATYTCNHGARQRPTYKHSCLTQARSYASSREPTLYEILDVPVTATPSEIKKKFYSLSLRHHPDRNRSDPNASGRFAKISSAYHVLSNAAKRAAYDRDNGIHSSTSTSTHSTANPGQHPMGSHSSHSSYGASYFGSRPASGLSKRRGPFRGPPPSFYAHGGYGSHVNKRAPPNSSTSAGGRAGSSGAAGGAAGHDDPTSFIHRNPVSHFNARGHYRTQSAEDMRRKERQSRQSAGDINDQYIGSRGDFIVRFVAVSGILVGAVALTELVRLPSSSGTEKTGKRKYSVAKDG
ncbi:DnaJ domain-containing protein [Aspergillus egyptiacus]|nr:DnaJ domain-containing protein [Aspergillus egyptiacus]